MKSMALLGIVVMLLGGYHSARAQCLERISRSTNKKEHYHIVKLAGKSEYLSLSKIGEEKVFTYHNEEMALVYHVQMFTEIQFTTGKETFKLYTTTSDRNFWNRSFMLSTPVTPKELSKMNGTVKIEVLLPEDKKVYTLGAKSTGSLNEALTCIR